MTTIVEAHASDAPTGSAARTAPAHPDVRVEFPVAGLPVSDLATLLEATPAPARPDVDLIEAIAGWEQVMSAAAARQAELVHELYLRRTRQGNGGFVSDELACALVGTGYAAQSKVGLALSLAAYPSLRDALLDGTMDVRKVTIVLDEIPAEAPADVRAALVADAIAHGAELTTSQLRPHVRRVLARLDPSSVRERAARSRADRNVRLEPCADTMAWLTAYLPAADAVAAFTVIDALADALPPGDERTVAQRRADAFADVFTGLLDGSLRGTDPLPRRHGERASLHVTMNATTLLGLDDEPAELAGYGPLPADVGRELAGDATWHALLADARTGEAVLARTPSKSGYRPCRALADAVIARDVTCTFPGCRQPARRGDLDHRIPFDPGRPAAQQTILTNLHALCRHHHLLKTHGGWSVVRDERTGCTRWTTPAGITYARAPSRIVVARSAMRHAGAAAPPGPDVPPPF